MIANKWEFIQINVLILALILAFIWFSHGEKNSCNVTKGEADMRPETFLKIDYKYKKNKITQCKFSSDFGGGKKIKWEGSNSEFKTSLNLVQEEEESFWKSVARNI